MATTGVEVPEDADSDALFVDTNILVYANVASAPLHEAALTALTSAHEAGRTLWISRQVLCGSLPPRAYGHSRLLRPPPPRS